MSQIDEFEDIYHVVLMFIHKRNVLNVYYYIYVSNKFPHLDEYSHTLHTYIYTSLSFDTNYRISTIEKYTDKNKRPKEKCDKVIQSGSKLTK